MYSHGLLTVARVALRYLLRLFMQLLPLILGLCVSVVLFDSLAQLAAGQPPYFSSLVRLIGWVVCALCWLLLAWFSVFTSYLTCPGYRLNRQLSLAYLQRSSLSSGS